MTIKAHWVKQKARQEMIVEDRRLIVREKLMIDPTSIVLIDDFFEYAVSPAIESHEAFTSIFRDGVGIERAANNLAQTGFITTFTLPLSALEDKAKDRAVKLITARVDEIQKEFEAQKDASKQFIEDWFDDDVDFRYLGGCDWQGKQQTIDYMTEEICASALYVQDLVLAMDMHRRSFGKPVGTHKYEERALRQNEGAHVIAFWSAVNNLKDYSGFFPDKPPPRGDKPDDKGGRIKVGGFKPRFA